MRVIRVYPIPKLGEVIVCGSIKILASLVARSFTRKALRLKVLSSFEGELERSLEIPDMFRFLVHDLNQAGFRVVVSRPNVYAHREFDRSEEAVPGATAVAVEVNKRARASMRFPIATIFEYCIPIGGVINRRIF